MTNSKNLEPGSMKYAHQCHFSYGWDYVGSCDGDRLLFDTKNEADQDLDDFFNDPNVDQHPLNWRVVPYNPDNDTKADL